MPVDTMSLSDSKEYGELFECDDIISAGDYHCNSSEPNISRGNMPLSPSRLHPVSMTDRLSSSRLPSHRLSEISMDISDLQEILDAEEDTRNGRLCSKHPSRRNTTRRLSHRLSEISMDLNDLQETLDQEEDARNGRFASGTKHAPKRNTTRRQSHRLSEISLDLNELQELIDTNEDDERNGRGMPLSQHLQKLNISGSRNIQTDSFSAWGDGIASSGSLNFQNSSVNGSRLKIDDIPEDYFRDVHSEDDDPYLRLFENNNSHLSTVAEQGESESSMSASSLAKSAQSLSQKKVRFAASVRLEVIEEFEKPDLEDYPNLYYSAHELQKMIDNQNAEDPIDRR